MMNPINQLASQIPQPASEVTPPQDETRDTFRQFVGQTFFGQLLSSMHKSHDKAAYFHGGRAEEIFQQQLDQVYVEQLTEESSGKIADPMFELFQLNRRQ